MKPIKLACVIGIPSLLWDERPIVIVELHPNTTITLQEIRTFCQNHGFAKFQLPDDVLIVNELPLTGTGKVSKQIMREQLKKQGYQLPNERKQ